MKKLRILFLIMSSLVPLLFVGCKEDDSQLSTPANLTVNNGVIIFDAVSDAHFYSVNINDLSVDIYVNKNNIQEKDGKVIYDINSIIDFANSYKIKVQACHGSRPNSEYTKEIEYLHINDLDDVATSLISEKSISWDNVSHATSYQVKVITPDDKVLFDKDGNILVGDSSENIEKAELISFILEENRLEFNSILSSAGEYSFYVRAKYEDSKNVAYGKFKKVASYQNFIKLSTPEILSIEQKGQDIILTATLDENANKLKISCEGYSATKSVNTKSIQKDGNLIKVNLNEFFEDVKVDNKTINLAKAQDFNFTLKAEREEETETLYYLNSLETNKVFSNKVILDKPTNVSIYYDEVNRGYVVNWSKVSHVDVAGYKITVATSTGLTEHGVTADKTNYFVGEDVIGVMVEALGPTSHYTSKCGDFVEISNSSNLESLTLTTNNNIVSWNNVADYYVVIVDNEVFSTTENTFVLEREMCSSKFQAVKVIAVREGFKTTTKTISVNMSIKLETPIIENSEAEILDYTIKVNPVENAIGYYVYISTSSSYTKINHLFTSNTINLTKYVNANGKYSSYNVKVESVADENSLFITSEKSAVVKLSTAKKLANPKVYSVGNTQTPIIKDGDKEFLWFYGVDKASSYNILINYNLKTVSSIMQDPITKLLKVDVSEYMREGDEYTIQIQALTTISGYKNSEYITAGYKKFVQLGQTSNIKSSQKGGLYTLNFDQVEFATYYKVKIIAESTGKMSEIICYTNTCDISKYILATDVYNISIVACSENQYYTDSVVSKASLKITR